MCRLPALRVLTLTSWPLQQDGVVAIASALDHLPRLQCLSLRDTQILVSGYGRDAHYLRGVHALANAIEKAKHLHTLNLEANNLDRESLAPLASPLKRLRGLSFQCLCLRNNPIYLKQLDYDEWRNFDREVFEAMVDVDTDFETDLEEVSDEGSHESDDGHSILGGMGQQEGFWGIPDDWSDEGGSDADFAEPDDY